MYNTVKHATYGQIRVCSYSYHQQTYLRHGSCKRSPRA